MKRIAILFGLLMFIACKNQEKNNDEFIETNQNPIQLGKEIFEGKGNCSACHMLEQKVIGPSIRDISKIYKAKNANLIDFLKNDAKPIIDPEQYEVMKTNFAITKAMTDEELKAIEVYIYSN